MMSGFRLFLAMFLCAPLLAGCAGGAAASDDGELRVGVLPDDSASPHPDSTRVAVGDSIIISVWGYAEFSTSAVVRGNGAITLPLIGDVPAAGVTREVLTATLRERLTQFVTGEPRVSVVIVTSLPRIFVLGAVNRQGSFPVNSSVPLFEALSLAGGITKESDLRFVRITRSAPMAGEHHELVVDVEEVVNRGRIASLPQVRAGDLVFVPAKEDVVLQLSSFLLNAVVLLGAFGLSLVR